jgi:hypothetical protein
MADLKKWAYVHLWGVMTADGDLWAVFADKDDAEAYANGGTFGESDKPEVIVINHADLEEIQ